MNRRNFLKLLAPMPFVAPAIVTACGQTELVAGGIMYLSFRGVKFEVIGDIQYSIKPGDLGKTGEVIL